MAENSRTAVRFRPPPPTFHQALVRKGFFIVLLAMNRRLVQTTGTEANDMLRLPSYLQRHPGSGIYYFRIAIPKSVASQLKQREWKRSLRTRDPQVAKRTARLLSLQAEFVFAQLERMPMSKKVQPTLGLAIKALTKHPDGRVEVRGLEMDPDKAEAELELLRALTQDAPANTPLPAPVSA